MASRRRIALVVAALASAGALAACGEEKASVPDPPGSAEHAGDQLFYSHCSGCHTLSVAGAQGSATQVRDRERVDGPNFDQRKETYDQVLYAIRNGGFSGAIMPENIVTGAQARDIAKFLEKYSGRQAKSPPAPQPSSSSGQ
jgi:mono/diheme cytochrome c family protein